MSKDIQEEIINTFGNKLRVRVSGLLLEEDKVLLIKHTSLGDKGIFWSPPGGGLNFGESAIESLEREFKEETGLNIEVIEFLFAHEFLRPPLHAIELFFLVEKRSGKMSKGTDPELSQGNQIIQDIQFFSMEEIKKDDPDTFHNLFLLVENLEDLKSLKGFHSYTPNKK